MVLPTRIDRYPAKMVSRLASHLVERYACGGSALLDPFCGSGAVLLAAQETGMAVTGVDINPYALLLSGVKLKGFDVDLASAMCQEVVRKSMGRGHTFPTDFVAKNYWFSPHVIRRYERFRYEAQQLELSKTPEGRSILLAFALSVRLCSRADSRSPKPFISKRAIKSGVGQHVDPLSKIGALFSDLARLYGCSQIHSNARLVHMNMANAGPSFRQIGAHSHIITSPPYINAQDYFRNFKLELHLLEGLVPFQIEQIKEKFIGTERGVKGSVAVGEAADLRRAVLPELKMLEQGRPDLARVVHRYFDDMTNAFKVIRQCTASGGVLVVVCGDNLVGGLHIRTWSVINKIVEDLGYVKFDSFGDKIVCRSLPPARLGHKGLIKEEIVSAFRLQSRIPC